MKARIVNSRGILLGLGGCFAGMFAAQTVSWGTWQKAGVAMAVSVAVSLLLLAVLPKKVP